MGEHEDDQGPSLLEHVQNSAIYAPKLLEQQILMGGRTVLGIFTVLPQLILRRDFGTQAIHPITFCVGWLVIQLVAGFGAFIPAAGMVGVGSMYLAFGGLVFLHSWRLRPKFLKMSLEEDGEDEGRPWGVFWRLPYASYAVISCVYEPLALIAISYALHSVGVLTSVVAVFLAVLGLCHGIRSMLRYYEIWVFVRDLHNVRNRARRLQMIMDGKGTVAQAESIVMTSGPALAGNPAAQTAIVSVIDPEFAAIKTV